MKYKINVRPIINKLNKQVNISIPKKQLPKDFFKNLPNKKLLKLILEDL